MTLADPVATTDLNLQQRPTPVITVDKNGNYAAGGAGTQYTDGATAPTHPVGTEIVFNNSGTMTAVSAANGLPITGSITATNPSVGSTGAAIPASATMAGASDGTNLRALQVESSSQLNLRVGIYQGANEVTVTGANALKVDNSGVTQPISASSLPLPTGASTAAKQPALGTAGSASSDVLTVQGIASMTALKVDGSGVTQPVSGTITANAGTGNFTVVQATGSNLHAVLDSGSTTAATQATASNLNAQVVGATASGASNAGNPVKIAGVYNSTQPTVTTGQIVDVQATVRGAQIVAPGVDNFGVQLQAAAGTALVADQSNTELRTSTYVKTTTAGDTALTLGQATMANSLPVTMASNQGAVPVGPSAGTAFDTNQGTVGANTLRVVNAGAATGTKTNVSSSATSVTILASNTSRKGALFYNDSTQICYLDLSGGTASTSSYSVQMPSQSLFELPGPVIYNGLVTGIWASANGSMRVTEFS